MPIQVRRFGVGHRRPQGPPGTTGVTGTPIQADAAGVIAELAFARGGRIAAHTNPNPTWFIVIEGGGYVQVGDEVIRIGAGEAVAWPPDVDHSAWTESSELRAIVVEMPVGGRGVTGRILEGSARAIGPGEGDPAARGDGALAPRMTDPADVDRSSGEPL